MSIIISLLDTDFYIFTMQNLIFHRFPSIEVKYEFKCRNNINLLPYKKEIEEEIDNLCNLKFKDDELKYLSKIKFLSKGYINFLEDFTLKRRFVNVYEKDGQLAIKIKGPNVQVMMFEVPILAIVNEVYFRHQINKINYTDCINKLNDKINLIKNSNLELQFQFADFGTRRRFSRDWHDYIIKRLKQEIPNNFIGTSNCYFSKNFNIKQIGTMSHSYFQLGQGLENTRLEDSQKYMLQQWAYEYRGNLGIALTDTIGIDVFLRDFDLYFAKLFSGVRHDSGDAYEFGDKVIKHYYNLNIDPMTKTIVFSDGLDFHKAIDLCRYFNGRINTSFGIGTNLTNDTGLEPLQIVIKMTSCNYKPVAKISDSPGKIMCKDEEFLNYLKKVYGVK